MRAVWIFLLVLLSIGGAFVSNSAFGGTPLGYAVQSLLGIVFGSLTLAAWTGARSIQVPPVRTRAVPTAGSRTAAQRPPVASRPQVTRPASGATGEPRFSWLFPVSVVLGGWALMTAIILLVDSRALTHITGAGGSLQTLAWAAILFLPIGHGILAYTAIAYSVTFDDCLSLFLFGVAALAVTLFSWNVATLVISGQTLLSWSMS